MRFTDNASISASAMDDADILAGTDVSDSSDKKFTLGNLGAWFLSTYAGQTLAGAAQTVKAAIDKYALNSYMELGDTIESSSDLNNFVVTGKYSAGTSVATTLVNCPTSVGFSMYVEVFTSTGKKQTLIDNNGATWTRYNISNNTTSWSTWAKEPVAADITAISNKLGVFNRAVSATVSGGSTYDATGLASGVYVAITVRLNHTSLLYDGLFLCTIGATNSHFSTILQPTNLSLSVGGAKISVTNSGTAAFALIIYRV